MISLTTIPQPPKTTMSVDATVYMGQNQIRRNVGAYKALYVGDNIIDRVITIQPSSEVSIQEIVKSLVVKTDCHLVLSAQCNESPITLYVEQFLALDSTLVNLVLRNDSPNIASVHVTYLAT